MYYDYFPMTEGRYAVYSVQEIEVDNQLKDTSDYFLKTVIGEEIIDNAGRNARVYNRYTGPTANGPWHLKDIWTCVIDGPRAELVEENNRTIKLVFAPSEDDEWDMNAYNTLGGMECYYSNIHQPYSINGNSFSSTVTVEQEDFNSYIDSRRKYEVYARGVGLVHKYFRDFIINNGNPNNVKKGRSLMMELVSYGQE
ncbi:hypothetical protein D3C87_35160 [compost metagenome]